LVLIAMFLILIALLIIGRPQVMQKRSIRDSMLVLKSHKMLTIQQKR
uniref:Sugar transferase n=1 Tax=Brugia timori TaxID=42155 RepID=A0A0R3QG76_9BILA